MILSGVVLVAVAVSALVSGYETGAAVFGGLALVTFALPVLRRRIRLNLGLRQHLRVSILFCLVVAVVLAWTAASTDSPGRALLWLSAAGFFGMAIAGVAMDLRLRKKEDP